MSVVAPHLSWTTGPLAHQESFSKPPPPARADSEQTLVEEPPMKQIQQLKSFERPLGPSELSYYLQSRGDGINDVFLLLGFRALPILIERQRVNLVWAILRQRHPLMSSRMEMHSYDDVRYVYDFPLSPEHALESAMESLEFRSQTRDDLLDSYLDGPRTLSDSEISRLIISTIDVPKESSGTVGPDLREVQRDYSLMICSTHYLADGMALHTFANEFFKLLTSAKSQQELQLQLCEEWNIRYKKTDDIVQVMPASLESQLPAQSRSRFRRAAAKVDFRCSQRKLIGGQSFPRQPSGSKGRTLLPVVSFDEVRTQKMIKNCKRHGVSISTALFAVCNIAWARLRQKNSEDKTLPTMMYSALNLRSHLTKSTEATYSYWFLAIGYFNVMLPTFLPSTEEEERRTFWFRARSAKEQASQTAKHPFLADRAREMAALRSENAKKWAKEDDDKAAGRLSAPAPVIMPSSPTVPSAALLGLSLLGNLDGMYQHELYNGLELNTLTTGPRQRPGGVLMHVYTFKGKLWISISYHSQALEPTTIEKWRQGVYDCVEEFLVEDH